MKTRNRTRESGNVFLIILMAVVLFAALAFVISRGMRSETTSSMSQRQSELAAVDILNYAQRLERAVSKIRSKNVSENDLDFDNESVPGYAHGQPDEHKVFNAAGGGMTWQNPVENVNDGSPWLFAGEACIVNVGSGAAGCASDSVNNEELLAVLPNIAASVCSELNKRLGISPTPSGGSVMGPKFAGDYDDGVAPNVDGLNAACFESGGNYFFYFVLLAR